MPHHVSGKHVSCTSQHALQSQLCPCCPSETLFTSPVLSTYNFFPHDIFCTLCSCFPLPPRHASSLHSFPLGACPLSQAPTARGESFGELGWPVCGTKSCLCSREQPRPRLSCTKGTSSERMDGTCRDWPHLCMVKSILQKYYRRCPISQPNPGPKFNVHLWAKQFVLLLQLPLLQNHSNDIYPATAQEHFQDQLV